MAAPGKGTDGHHGPAQGAGVAGTFLRNAQMWYPVVLLLVFIISAGIYSIVTSRTEVELVTPTAKGPGGKPLPITKKRRQQKWRQDQAGHSDFARTVFKYAMGATVLSFVANGAAIAVHALQSGRTSGEEDAWWCGEERVVYVIGSAFLYVYVLITLFECRQNPTAVHQIFWVLGLVGEVTILLSSVLTLAGGSYVAHGGDKPKQPADSDELDSWDVIDLTIAGVRLCLILFMASLYAILAAKRRLEERRFLDEEAQRSDNDETSPLLDANGNSYQARGNGSNGSGYGGTNGSSSGSSDQGCQLLDEEAAFYRPEKLPHKSWLEYCRGYSVFFPYLWPGNSPHLQGVVLVCFILVVCQRAVNVLVPAQIRIVTELLTKDGNQSDQNDGLGMQLGLLILYKLLQGQSGLLGSMRSILWIPVSQHTYRALTTAAFEHVHSLSLDFHLGKRTGEVLSALNKGASINTFLEQVTFQVIPVLVDLLVAIVFFYAEFGPMYSLFVAILTFYYLYLTISMAATRADQRRDMVNADREEVAVKNDSIMSYETVKYFNAEKVEFERYRNAIDNFQTAEAKVTWGLSQMNMCQSLVFMCGMLVAILTCGYEVSQGKRTVGHFTLLITYLSQLQGPLNFFGTFYRTVQQAMISGERLLELFKIQPTVVDRPGAETLSDCRGHIKWTNVGFSYDKRRPALHDVSFECRPGTTTAFVGESGGGKSTIFRIMFRYYNCREGSVQVDGRDVKDLTIDSVRRSIGVVPQDTILFNETLMYNLKYANPSATDEDVYEACRAAAVHDRIMSFPDGYQTKVGERGLRLSGGEKQRVAIARTILKKPKIIMLDEATSALDGETEQKIQSKLISGKFGQGRTLMIIAHRLSTITHADQIIVLHAGAIVERGTHEELLALNGRYAAMWEKHCRAERAAEQARDMTRKAKKLMSQANLSQADDLERCRSISSSSTLATGPNSPTVAASGHDNESVSSDDCGASSAGSEGTLRDEGCDDNRSGTETPQRPPLFSYPSETSSESSHQGGGILPI